jgi:hypothetical protein
MGAIIYWGLVRFAIVLFACWAMMSYIGDYSEWWTMFFVAVSVVVIYPAQMAYRRHASAIKRANRNELCATCRYHDAENALCTSLDEHVTMRYTPCGGSDWEPIGISLG